MNLVGSLCWISAILTCQASQFGSGGDKNSIIVENVTESLEAINGTMNFRLIKPNRATPWYPEREIKLDSCVRRAQCETLEKATSCLGAKLAYDKTSVHLTFYETQTEIQNQLELYRGLINVPKCWAVIQPLLCATFMPKCEKILGKDMVYLPSYEMCKITMEPCAILHNTSYFPSFLKCNSTLFPPRCDNAGREMKFNTTGKCLPPLIHTNKPLHFYEGISGCGLPCRDPLYTEDEHQQIHRLVAWGAGTCLALNLLTVATFLIDWRSANKYPALVIFYINVCFAVASMGWLVQFGVGSRDDIVCSKDGTRRQGEPSAEENLSCVVVFVLVYYFMMAACVWFVIFTYAWHMSFRALGKIQDRIDKKAAYFHLVAWSLPLVLTIATMAFGEVDGSSVTGVCFVGYVNHPMRAALLLAPLAVVLMLGGYFLLRGVFSLIAVRVSSKDVISPRAANKIRQTITRCSITAALVAVFICVTFACHIYEFRNADLWKEAFKRNIICRLEALKDSEKECSGGARPSVSVLQLRLLCCFAAGGLMASWTWTPAAAAAWRRYLARKCGCSVEAEVTRRARKHELIARAYRRRGEFAARGRLSISLGGSRQDPVGLCLDHTAPIDYPDNAKHERLRGAVVVVGGQPAALRAAARRAGAAGGRGGGGGRGGRGGGGRAGARVAELHARPPQLAGLADQHQPATRLRRVAPELARQPALRQDRRDEDQGRPPSHEALESEAQGPRRVRPQGEHAVHREPDQPLLAPSGRCEQRPLAGGGQVQLRLTVIISALVLVLRAGIRKITVPLNGLT